MSDKSSVPELSSDNESTFDNTDDDVTYLPDTTKADSPGSDTPKVSETPKVPCRYIRSDLEPSKSFHKFGIRNVTLWESFPTIIFSASYTRLGIGIVVCDWARGRIDA